MSGYRLLILLLALLAGGCKEEKAERGEIAPALAAVDLRGEQADLPRWRGKAIYLNFWSAGCGVCLAEMSELEALSRRWADKLVVVGVNTDPDSQAIAPLLAQHGVTFPVLRDRLGISQERYQVIGTPTSVLIDKQGRVLEIHQGWRQPQALQAVFASLAGQ